MLIKKILYPLTSKEYKTIFILLILTITASFFEMLSIGIIIPVFNLFAGNEYLNYFKYFNFFNLKEKNEILIFILFIFGFAHFIKFILNRSLILLQLKFSHNLHVNVAEILFNDYLNRDYSFYIYKNSSQLVRNILSETNLFSFGVIFHVVRLITEMIIFICIAAVLFVYNFKVSIMTICFFSIAGYFFYKSNSAKLKKYGELRQFHSEKILKQLQEGFLGFRELVLNKLQNIFFKNFSYHTQENARVGIKKDSAVQMPRLILELMTIIILILIVVFLIYDGYEINEIFVLIGVFLYATIRVLPSVAKIIQSIQSIKYNEAVIELIYDEIKNIKFKSINKKLENNLNKSNFEYKKIKIQNVDYFYRESEPVLNQLNIEINKGEKIGLIGKSGSGKSTFINLLCGLIKPKKGNIEIDNKELQNVIYNYQKSIGYVPQNVTIFDESILFNITLNFDESKVDLNKLNRILKEMDLYDTIYKLPNNLYERAGESGVKLSGGQCQRLGIARVLYRDPSIIILDEATSGLDSETEEKILKTLYANYKENTIFFSTHRINPLKFCDIIYEIQNKNLKKKSSEK